MELVDALEASFAHTGTVVAGIRPEQLGSATPCTEWDVRALLAHMIGVVTNIGQGVRGEELLADPNATVVAADPAEQFRAAAAGTLAAWRSVAPDAEVNIGAGPMPAMVGASINLLDTTAHCWDLARATGQSEALPVDLVDATMGAAEMVVTPEIRQFAGIAPAVDVAADASATDRLVAFLGRRP
jgi:uncharacterized protein (TIGR03086 family)